MSVLVVGMSHRSAPIDVLERASLDTDAAVKLAHRALESASVTEAAVISTCNRVEVYVEADRFHNALEDVSHLLAEQAGMGREDLVHHAYVHYDDSAVAHLFSVASGMDSMILGESQILGQVRQALHTGQAESTIGSALNALFQQALRIGKRGHAETGIDRLAPSTVTAGLDAVGPVVTAPGTRFLVAGAGTMASLAVRTLVDRGVAPHRIMVANRTFQRAYELVATFGVSAVRWEAMDVELSAADVVISCTGAAGSVFATDRVSRVLDDGLSNVTGELVFVDLALPRDVEAGVAELESVSVIDLVTLAARSENAELAADVQQVRAIVDDEVRSFLAAKSQSRVTPTVVALRSMATEVVEAETSRLLGRLHGLPDEQVDQVRLALKRVADKLIHAPTVRVQQLVDGPGGLTYADALSDLFALDPAAVQAVTQVKGEKA
ncbi:MULTISPECIES: glutamyl-tRNA reductase [unclassified Aeromicrobium]|uniref:glutamyl-tRNA reductase n=1 Tax=unclassified Aeromicrobium TaxID=2633570 RepID=UPI0006FC97CE|nr:MULTISPECIES: glutamyl-tRNA reductase [unclassified Aeromicrobium]KQO36121.1 glutamyl-tRNA reductase [Aeromicrobium sp. Leaf245]KQP27611.1 glutamyl-tRNA reductase [Aeromicrobium sp. Leaf272]KQP78658.1 glutamyl-tRNA reductase [Aeromicrobium sp. Leaf289]KQP84368.1 glutamyl-tRNA reductase [Aeromicrobium sp. Leaf291]